MIDQQLEWIKEPYSVRLWAAGWIRDAGKGNHRGVKMIHEAADTMKERFCLDGFWTVDAKPIYDLLLELAGDAQDAYETNAPGMEG